MQGLKPVGSPALGVLTGLFALLAASLWNHRRPRIVVDFKIRRKVP
jgi:hypothetical protein